MPWLPLSAKPPGLLVNPGGFFFRHDIMILFLTHTWLLWWAAAAVVILRWFHQLSGVFSWNPVSLKPTSMAESTCRPRGIFPQHRLTYCAYTSR